MGTNMQRGGDRIIIVYLHVLKRNLNAFFFSSFNYVNYLPSVAFYLSTIFSQEIRHNSKVINHIR